MLAACFLKIFQLDGDYHEKHLKSSGVKPQKTGIFVHPGLGDVLY